MPILGNSVRVAALIAVAISAAGCAESSFTLARDSRLPAWFETPSQMSRDNLTVTMDYYIHSSGREAKFTLLDSGGRQLTSKSGAMRGTGPASFGDTDYPMYEVISVDGMVDVIEHRKMEPVFYVTDDPVVRKRLGAPERRGSK